jgi:hypothetical protein
MEFAIRLFSKGSVSATFSCSRAAVIPGIATYAGFRSPENSRSWSAANSSAVDPIQKSYPSRSPNSGSKERAPPTLRRHLHWAPMPSGRAEIAEHGTSLTAANELAVRRALKTAGVEFYENGGGPGLHVFQSSGKQVSSSSLTLMRRVWSDEPIFLGDPG